jgi:phosphatidylserine/phosphatidylglycerophosphate/cardiolipin synthase-like enzyme
VELSSAIIEIPVEILQVDLKVQRDDPLSKVFEITKSSHSSESSSPSLLRLEALSRSSHSSVSGKGDFSTPIIRDLWRGEYWRMSEMSSSLDAAKKGSVIPVEPGVSRISDATAKDEVADIAKPILGYLVRQSGVPRNQILSRTRLEGVSPEEEVVHLRARVVLRQDRVGRKYWVWDEGAFQKLIANHIQELPGFEMQESEQKESIQSWSYSPEIKALKRFKKSKNEEHALKILDSIREQIKQDKRPRLESVRQVVGFRQDMWDAAQVVIKSASKRTLILSSFSNSNYAEEVADLLAESVGEKPTETLLSFGEPDRGRSPDDIDVTKQYIASLSKDNRFNLKGGISPKSNHAKIILSDTGKVFICSCNLFSGSLESGVLETGLLIRDIECAKSILDILFEEDWISEETSKEAEKIRSDLGKIYSEPVSFHQSRKLSKIRYNIKHGRHNQAFSELETLLMQISERPVWSLIRTLEHRPLMADCIERFDRRLVMASDGLRNNGLDKATINRIGQRATESKSTVQIWWGRHAPGSKPFDERDKRGRREASDRLHKLRKMANWGENWWFLPTKSAQPMETHAKLFIVDDTRLIITSDNTLSFGDTESERGDAGELGIMIDHPRLAIQTRGSMEMWLPVEAIIKGDLTRWWALLGEEISHYCDAPSDRIPLQIALDYFIQRIESSKYLTRLWEREFESIYNQKEILTKLAMGRKGGLFSYSRKNGRRYLNSEKWPPESLGSTSVCLGWKDVWQKSSD